MEGTWVVKHWVPGWLWEGHVVPLTRLEPCPVKGERVPSLRSASGFEAVLTCRLFWVPLQLPYLSQLGRRGETRLSRSLTVNCFALRAIAMAGFLCMFYSRTPPPSKKTWSRKVFEGKVLRMRWIGTNWRELLLYHGVTGRCQARHCSCVLPCTLVAAWKLLLMQNTVSFEGISYHITGQVLQCILGYFNVFLLKCSFQFLDKNGSSGQVSRPEARKFAVHLVFRECSSDKVWSWDFASHFFHLENRRKYLEAFWKEKTGLFSAK